LSGKLILLEIPLCPFNKGGILLLPFTKGGRVNDRCYRAIS
jgi:hypothetical protein